MIKKFIENNNIDLSGTDSNLNSNCVIICGYALYKEISLTQLLLEIEKLDIIHFDITDEIKRVYEYALKNHYGEWWKSTEASDTYLF